MKKWIGLDPSIASFGYAVLARHEPHMKPVVLALGTFTTKINRGEGKLADRARRVAEIGADLVTLLAQHRDIEAVYVESLALGMRTGRGTAQTLGRVRGLVEGICVALKLPIAEVRPEVLKLAVAQRTDASKEEVARVVRAYYGVSTTNDDVTDALAVAHVGAHRHGQGAVISSGVVRYNPPEQDEEELD